MKEIKFLKDLPIKFTNKNKHVLDVIGGDIYYDTDGNRFGYITFKNLDKSPIFALQLFIREYDIDGKFIRDNELFESYTYYPKGEFVINEPILLDKETEAIEVTIVKLTLNNRNLINDKFVSFKKEDYIEIYQRKAPLKKPGTAGKFNFESAISSPTPVQAEEPEEVKAAPAVEEEEKPAPSSVAYSPIDALRKKQEAPVAQEAAPAEAVEEEKKAEEPAPEEKPAEDKPVEEEKPAEEKKAEAPAEPVLGPNGEKLNVAKKQKAIWAYIPAIAGVVAIALLTLIVVITVTRGVNAYNSSFYR